MASVPSLRDLPEIDLQLPRFSLAEEAATFAKTHCDEPIYNHAVRCAYWALIIAKKVPEFATSQIDIELMLIICILHDMGLAISKSQSLPGLSLDKRFEVDGANIAKDFISSRTSTAPEWNAERLARLWMAIALHTTPSIAIHAGAEIALANMAIAADFAGPYWSPRDHQGPETISMDEYRAITKAFPRGTFNHEGAKKILCDLCRKKPETTYDNFLGVFGRKFGYDGEGMGREKYAQEWEENQAAGYLLRGLVALDQIDASSGK